NRNRRWHNDKTGRRHSRSGFKWSAHQWLLVSTKNLVRKNGTQTELASTRINGHDRRRIAAGAQKLSAAPDKSFHRRDQRSGPYHWRRSHRQFAANFANNLRRSY